MSACQCLTACRLITDLYTQAFLKVYLFSVAYLTVLVSLTAPTEPPSGITVQPDPVSPVVLSQSVDLMCTATGDSPITYAWVLMGEETTRLNPDPMSGNFTLSITQVDRYGVYICIATNDLGVDAASINIIQASKTPLHNS